MANSTNGIGHSVESLLSSSDFSNPPDSTELASSNNLYLQLNAVYTSLASGITPVNQSTKENGHHIPPLAISLVPPPSDWNHLNHLVFKDVCTSIEELEEKYTVTRSHKPQGLLFWLYVFDTFAHEPILSYYLASDLEAQFIAHKLADQLARVFGHVPMILWRGGSHFRTLYLKQLAKKLPALHHDFLDASQNSYDSFKNRLYDASDSLTEKEYLNYADFVSLNLAKIRHLDEWKTKFPNRQTNNDSQNEKTSSQAQNELLPSLNPNTVPAQPTLSHNTRHQAIPVEDKPVASPDPRTSNNNHITTQGCESHADFQQLLAMYNKLSQKVTDLESQVKDLTNEISHLNAQNHQSHAHDLVKQVLESAELNTALSAEAERHAIITPDTFDFIRKEIIQTTRNKVVQELSSTLQSEIREIIHRELYSESSKLASTESTALQPAKLFTLPPRPSSPQRTLSDPSQLHSLHFPHNHGSQPSHPHPIELPSIHAFRTKPCHDPPDSRKPVSLNPGFMSPRNVAKVTKSSPATPLDKSRVKSGGPALVLRGKYTVAAALNDYEPVPSTSKSM